MIKMKIYIASWDNLYSSWSYNGQIRGFVKFEQENKDSFCKVSIVLKNVPTGLHGIHIHEKNMSSYENMETENPCDCTCGHFNPTDADHGHHYGDLCFNVESDLQGNVVYHYFDDKINIFDTRPEFCIVNRTIVLHEDFDNGGVIRGFKDPESIKNGRAGRRIACAEICEN